MHLSFHKYSNLMGDLLDGSPAKIQKLKPIHGREEKSALAVVSNTHIILSGGMCRNYKAYADVHVYNIA